MIKSCFTFVSCLAVWKMTLLSDAAWIQNCGWPCPEICLSKWGIPLAGILTSHHFSPGLINLQSCQLQDFPMKDAFISTPRRYSLWGTRLGSRPARQGWSGCNEPRMPLLLCVWVKDRSLPTRNNSGQGKQACMCPWVSEWMLSHPRGNQSPFALFLEASCSFAAASLKEDVKVAAFWLWAALL